MKFKLIALLLFSWHITPFMYALQLFNNTDFDMHVIGQKIVTARYTKKLPKKPMHYVKFIPCQKKIEIAANAIEEIDFFNKKQPLYLFIDDNYIGTITPAQLLKANTISVEALLRGGFNIIIE